MKKLIILAVVALCSCEKVESGQTWIYDPQPRNPFNKNFPDTNKVIDVRNGYVLYVNEGDTESCSVRWFKIESDLID